MTVLLAVTLLVFLLVGLSTGLSASSPDDYFVAGRRGSSKTIGGSLLATVVGGSATVGVAGLAYGRGLTAAWWTLCGAIGLTVLALVFVPRIRAWNVYTLPGLIGRMYGPRAAVATALLVVVAWMGVVSGQIVAAGLVLSVTGIGSAPMWMALFTTVLVAYVVVGGQGAVIRTDLVQAAVILVGLCTTLAVLLLGPDAVILDAGALPAETFAFPVSGAFGWSDLGSMLVLVGAVYVVGPDIYSRLFSARDSAAARKATLSAAALMAPVALMVTMLGISARALAPDIPAEQALPWLIGHALPPVASALLLAALMAALMSSADTTLLGQAVVLADELVRRIRPLDGRRTVGVARVCVVALGGVALVLALDLRGVIASLTFAYSIFTSGVVGPTVLGLVGGRLRPGEPAALAGMCTGGALGLLGVLPGLDVPLRPYLALIGLAASVLVPLAVTAWGRVARTRRKP